MLLTAPLPQLMLPAIHATNTYCTQHTKVEEEIPDGWVPPTVDPPDGFIDPSVPDETPNEPDTPSDPEDEDENKGGIFDWLVNLIT